jgi:YD repeat-containing protein
MIMNLREVAPKAMPAHGLARFVRALGKILACLLLAYGVGIKPSHAQAAPTWQAAYADCVRAAQYAMSEGSRYGASYCAWDPNGAGGGDGAYYIVTQYYGHIGCLGEFDEFPPVGSCQTPWWWHPTYDPQNPAKNLGGPQGCGCGEGNLFGDPVNSATGNKYIQEDDYVGDAWLTLTRFYNSALGSASTSIGAGWRHAFDRSLAFSGSPITTIVVTRQDGRQETFTKANSIWAGEPDDPNQLTETDDAQGNPAAYTLFVAATHQNEVYSPAGALQSVSDPTGQTILLSYSTASTPTSVAPKAGLLLTVTDTSGRSLNFSYNDSATVSQVTLPDGELISYTYDPATNNLLAVKYPGGKTRQYVYNESGLNAGTSVNALTGIIDEAGARYESTAYDSSGRVTQTGRAGSVDQISLAYGATGTTTVTHPLGLTSTLSFTTLLGATKLATLDQPCSPQCSRQFKSQSFDGNGYLASATDFNGFVTATTYNTEGLLLQKVEAQGQTSQRTTNFTWNVSLGVPLTRTVSNANNVTVSSTQWVYNSTGQTLARCEIDPTNGAASGYNCSNTGTAPAGVRRWTYIYCTAVDSTQCPLPGLLLTTTGPRTNTTTTYSYYMGSSVTGCGTPGAACYQAGDLHQVTDPLGHVTTIASYDADGRITRITDANGINTDITYTPRGWLASRSVGGATTSFTYIPYGSVHTVTDPDGVTTTYGYDAAHRLVKITDAQGNYIQYTLDAAGNKTAEQVYDTSGTLHKSLTRSFNNLGQLTKMMDGLNHIIFDASASNSYDASGNLVQSTDGLGIQRQQGYDALNRLVQTIDNYNGTN